jgi:hypothetical protein
VLFKELQENVSPADLGKALAPHAAVQQEEDWSDPFWN